MLSFRNFVVAGVTFKSLIHFELIFMSGVSQGPSLILLHMNIICPSRKTSLKIGIEPE